MPNIAARENPDYTVYRILDVFVANLFILSNYDSLDCLIIMNNLEERYATSQP